MASDAIDQGFFKIPTRALVISLGLHLTVPLLFFTLNVLDEHGLLPFGKKNTMTKEMYQNFIQVDVVALPDALIGDKKDVDTSLPIVENPKLAPEVAKPAESPDVMEHEGTEKEQAELKAKRAEEEKIAREKARQSEQEKALRRIREEAEREQAVKALADAQGKQPGRQKLGGNILSKGTATSGKIGTAKEQYTALVAQAVKANFNIYPWQRKKDLLAVVEIEIFPNGRVKRRRVIKASKDRLYDSAVLLAVDSAQPLPVPIDMSVVEDGIKIEFRPDE